MQPSKYGGSLRRLPVPRQPSMRRARSSVEIQRYAEGEQDEDFSDVFGTSEAILDRPESDQGSDGSTLMLQSKLSNSSWVMASHIFSTAVLMAYSLVMMMTTMTLSLNWRRALMRWVRSRGHHPRFD